mmetsp:Transcript_22833/g.56398  ORF Transcript_22833/g.56398 Transcript_22833/m.56398 type:complete len:758 (-) Transcript_22833:275-2548(-)
MGYRDLLPVQEPCWTEEGGLTVQCKALAVLDAMVRAPEDGWLRGGNADNDDGVLWYVHREGLLGRLVEDARVRAKDTNGQGKVLQKALEGFWEPVDAGPDVVGKWRFAKGSLWRRTEKPLPPVALFVVKTGEGRMRARAFGPAERIQARVDPSLLWDKELCQRVDRIVKSVREKGGACWEWEDERERNGVLFLRQVIDCWMGHVEGMGRKLREEMLQNISGACEEWLLSPVGEKQNYNMARQLLDACAAQVFQHKWAHRVPETVRGEGRTWLSQQPHGVMLRDLEEFIIKVLHELHPEGTSIHKRFTFGHILALCYPPKSPGQVHHFDLIGGGAYVLTLGLLPEGQGDGMEGTCVLELDHGDRKLLSECGEQVFHTFMVTWGAHVQKHISNPYGAIEDFCNDKGRAHVPLFRAWTGWLLSEGPAKVPLVTDADKRFRPLSQSVDSRICMMIPNVWHKGGSNPTSSWRVVAFIFVGSEMAGQYSFYEQWNSIVILSWAYGELSPVVVSQAVQWELCMGVRVCVSLAQPDQAEGKPKEFFMGWYLQQCTELALLLLGCDPKELLAPCSVCESSSHQGGLVRLAPVEGEDLVLSKPEGAIEANGRSIPYTTEIRGSGCLERQDAGVVDTIVRMFMGVACSEHVSEVGEDGEVIVALWEDVQDFREDGSLAGRVAVLLRGRQESSSKKRKSCGGKVSDMSLEGVKGLKPSHAKEVLQKASSLVKDIRHQRSLRQRAEAASEEAQSPGDRFKAEVAGLLGGG